MEKKHFEPVVRLQILDQASILKIHEATLQVLEETGVEINTDEGKKILLDAGCMISHDNVITIPARLVEKALRTAPSSVVLFDRLGEERCILEGWKTSYGTGSDCPFIIDSKTGERRLCTYQDISNGALVCDSLSNFDFVMPVGIISDRPTNTADVHAVAASMKNTIKPIVFTAHNKITFQASIDMAAEVTGGINKLKEKPFVCLYAEPTSPLRHMPEATDKLILAAQSNIPVIFTPCPLMGATAPGTKAGTLVQSNAECLSGLVLHQLVNPGAPIIFGGVINSLDMATTIAPYGSPELQLLCSAMTDLAHYYNLPMFGTAGCSDAKSIDAQAGVETGNSLLMSTLNGQNLIHDIGFLESALITSFELYILSDEIISQVKYIAGGIDVNPETMGVNVIHDVAHKGDYLGTDHTVKYLRKEFHFPGIIDRTRYTTWVDSGKKDLGKVLKEKAEHIINTYKTEPIPRSVVKAMQEVINSLEGE